MLKERIRDNFDTEAATCLAVGSSLLRVDAAIVLTCWRRYSCREVERVAVSVGVVRD